MRAATNRVRRGGRGMTLVELLVGLTITSVIVTLSLGAWRPMQSSTQALADRSRLVAELRLATESLLADLGGAASAMPVGETLLVTREQAVAEVQGAWSGGDDDGIVYELVGAELIRTDLELGTSVAVASALAVFEVSRPDGMTHVVLGGGSGLAQRSVELVWPE